MKYFFKHKRKIGNNFAFLRVKRDAYLNFSTLKFLCLSIRLGWVFCVDDDDASIVVE